MKKYSAFKNQLLKDKNIKNHYDKLDSGYLLLSQLIEKRIAAGLTQKELARKVGTKQSAISRLESGNYNPTLSFLSKVANGLGAKLRVEVG